MLAPLKAPLKGPVGLGSILPCGCFEHAFKFCLLVDMPLLTSHVTSPGDNQSVHHFNRCASLCEIFFAEWEHNFRACRLHKCVPQAHSGDTNAAPPTLCEFLSFVCMSSAKRKLSHGRFLTVSRGQGPMICVSQSVSHSQQTQIFLFPFFPKTPSEDSDLRHMRRSFPFLGQILLRACMQVLSTLVRMSAHNSEKNVTLDHFSRADQNFRHRCSQ